MTGTASLLVAAQLVSTIIYYVKIYRFTTFDELDTAVDVARAANAITAATDTVIAVILVYLVYSTRSGLKKTDAFFDRFLAFIVNTGLATGICAIADLITSLALPSTLIYILFYLMIPHRK